MSEEEPGDRLAGPLLRTAIGTWLLVMGVLATWVLLSMFPTSKLIVPTAEQLKIEPGRKPDLQLVFGRVAFQGEDFVGPETPQDRGLAILALVAGVCGSFLHAARSFAGYVGNRQLKASWSWWYFTRLPIGAVLGVLFYFVIRAGLLSSSTDSVSPYGVVAFGALAGWFSERASDKLAEVFDVVFGVRKDKLKDPMHADEPSITVVTPSPVPAQVQPPADVTLDIEGTGFVQKSRALLGDKALATTFVTATKLKAVVTPAQRPVAGTKAELKVVNPPPQGTSVAFPLTFQ